MDSRDRAAHQQQLASQQQAASASHDQQVAAANTQHDQQMQQAQQQSDQQIQQHQADMQGQVSQRQAQGKDFNLRSCPSSESGWHEEKQGDKKRKHGSGSLHAEALQIQPVH